MTVPLCSTSVTQDPNFVQILTSVLSPQPEERTHAEQLLSTYGSTPGLLVQLVRIGLDTTQSTPVRQMGLVVARKQLRWEDRGQDEQCAVKHMLLDGLKVRRLWMDV